MQIIDVYTKKEYECKICKGKVYYAKVTNDKGELYTIDNLLPNGKYGKESNVLTCQVDTLVKDQVHKCQKTNISEKIKELEGKQPTLNTQVQERPKTKEMSVTDFAEPAMRKEIEVHCKVLRIIEDEVNKFLGKDVNPTRVGMWMKMIYDMMEQKKK